MFLSCMTILSAVVGSSSFLVKEDLCHGGTFTFPAIISPRVDGVVYFTPSKWGSKRLVINEGVVEDPRIRVSNNNDFYIADLTERDAGIFSKAFIKGLEIDIIKLDISDCAKRVSQYYGETYYTILPEQTEYVEYSPRISNPVVLWNRSDPQTSQGGRSKVRRGILEITSITQEDNGYYDFKEKNRNLLSRILLTVEGNFLNYKENAGEEFFIGYPSDGSTWTVSVKLKGVRKNITLVNAGTLVTESNLDAEQFNERVQLLRDGVKINPLETTDSGRYEFKDPQNNLGLTVLLEVESALTAPPSMMVIVGMIAAVIVAVVICFCCVRRCCRTKSKTPAVRLTYHREQDQSSSPSYSVAHAPDQSYQPMNPGVSVETAAFSSEPPVSVLRGQGDTSAPMFSSDCPSSDPGPRFELKGLNIPFASPLSSDSANAVYSSDKLNFL